MKNFLLWIWQAPQNIIGFLLSRFSEYKDFNLEDGPVRVYFNNRVFGSGISLGSFIVLDKNYLNKNNKRKLVITVMHEHGHQLQSRNFGIVYLLVIGLPSLIGNLTDRFFHRNWSQSDRDTWYYKKLPWEKDADKRGKVIRF